MSGWTSRALPWATLMMTHDDEAGADADRDVVRERHQDHRQQGGDAVLDVR